MPALGPDSSDEEDEAPESQPAPSTPKGGMLWQRIPEDQPDFWMHPDKPQSRMVTLAPKPILKPSESSLPTPTSAPSALSPCTPVSSTQVLKPVPKSAAAPKVTNALGETSLESKFEEGHFDVMDSQVPSGLRIEGSGQQARLVTMTAAPPAPGWPVQKGKQKTKLRKPILKPGPLRQVTFPEIGREGSVPERPSHRKVLEDYDPPGPEQSWQALEAAATVNGQWQTDSSRHQVGTLHDADPHNGILLVEPKENQATLKVAYFFSGLKRRSSVASHLAKMCKEAGVGLRVFEIDVLIGGSDHDLLDKESQELWLARIAQGDFDFVILSPPCGSWSRANWADDKWPQPCRDRTNPWGLPRNSRAQKRRATQGNEFIHFSIRALELVKDAKNKGFRVRCLLEHPEDLGRTHRGCPASI